jgi:hypothetical protein
MGGGHAWLAVGRATDARAPLAARADATAAMACFRMPRIRTGGAGAADMRQVARVPRFFQIRKWICGMGFLIHHQITRTLGQKQNENKQFRLHTPKRS